MASIRLEHVTKSYDGVTVIPDLELEIRDKEFLTLVGPSGCGKSTTLRMIAGLEEITSGDLFIGEKRVNDIPPKDRDIAMVFQSYALYPHMSVYKNMAFGLTLRRMPKDEIDKKVREAAKILDIERYLDRKPRALSGGQRQRVALGRAMVRNPAVFLLDEPLSNLDAKLRTEMRSQITRLHRQLETTFVYVTHDQTEAMTMADRIVVMKDGVIQQADTPQMLYSQPCNLFVAGFIGSPQMNFLDARLRESPDGYRLEIGRYSILLSAAKAGAKTLAPYLGKKVVAGIRPEDLHAEEAFLSIAPDSRLDGVVELAEMMGPETHVHLTTDGQRLTARVPSRMPAAAGDRLTLALDQNRLHLFDPDSGRVICS